MYHNGYVETLPVQLTEVTQLIKEYFKEHYNHNYISIYKLSTPPKNRYH